MCRGASGLGQVEGGQQHRQRGPRGALGLGQHAFQLAEAVVDERELSGPVDAQTATVAGNKLILFTMFKVGLVILCGSLYTCLAMVRYFRVKSSS